MKKPALILGSLTLLAAAATPAAHAAEPAPHSGYWQDASGKPWRAADGSCIRSGSWSASNPRPGCDAMPDQIVLLPQADGSVGAVIIRSATTEQTLNRAYAGAEIGAGGAITQKQESAASVQQKYGSALQAQPPLPVAFTVQFANATELTPEAVKVIENIKATLAARPFPEISVVGHTDRAGSDESNDALSLKRAQAVRDILVNAGVKPQRMDVAGRGERQPVVPTADGVTEPRNRRVEISIR